MSTHIAYTLAELAAMLPANERTIRRWIAEGLKTVPGGKKPVYIRGSDLKAFLSAKNAKGKATLRPHEFWCFRCRAPRKARKGSIRVTNGQKKGICDECGGKISRTISRAIRPARNVYTIPLLPV